MNWEAFKQIITGTQVSTALVLIAGALVAIVVKLYLPKKSSR